jgi:Ala-tRNA(Pro) deacylase
MEAAADAPAAAAAAPASSSAAAAPAPEREEEAGTHAAVLALLAASGASFTTLAHAPTRTSEESAAVRGVPLASGAKAMLLKSGKPLACGGGATYVLAVLSAARKAELGRLKKGVGAKDLRMASVEEVWQVTRCLPGAVPPFGCLFTCPRSEGGGGGGGVPVLTVVEEGLEGDCGGSLNFNAGLRTASVCGLAFADYVAAAKPMRLAFAQAS